jgi:hypothetical protein
MSRPTGGDDKGSSKPGNDEPNRRRTRKRRRTLLNLGMPFVQLDDLLNQSEDAVALGYRVLEETVEEIRQGYHDAQEFNAQQRAWDGKGPPPPIPWVKLVERVQNLQNFAFHAVRDSTDILFDSLRSGTESMLSMAKTVQQSRSDAEDTPVLAGPVIEELIEITARAGERPDRVEKRVRHRGLTRLRIHAVMDPPLKELLPPDTGRDASSARPLNVEKVSFEPASGSDDEEFSVLTVEVGMIERSQTPADYEGLIKAGNFELIIARLRVHVLAAETETPARPKPRPRPRPRPTKNARGRPRT